MLYSWAMDSNAYFYKCIIHIRLALNSRTDKKLKGWYEEPDKDRRITRTVEIDRCNCQRKISAHTMTTYDGDDTANKSISTCSFHSYYRGAKQKTVAFSFYGNPESIQVKERKYFEGIKANLKAMPKIYPDWTLRLYYDLPNGHYLMQDLCDLACNDSNIGK